MPLLSPQSIAVIGASSDEGSVGYEVLKNLLTQEYAGKVYPVNPKHAELQGVKAYKTVRDIEEDVDLAIIIVPAKIVPTVMRECTEKNIEHIVIISAGFGETHTDEGKRLEQEIIDIAKQHFESTNKRINVLGPNCLGFVRPSQNLNASFAIELPPKGNVGFISQSGATAVALMDAAASYGIGFSAVFSIGNKTVLDECDMVELLLQDEETAVIGLYLESVKDGARFVQVAAKAAAKKPIVLLKAGVSEQGRKAAASHTGALAGSDGAIDALCAEAGIRRARSSEECFDLLAALSAQPALPTDRIAVITNAGGPGILATDAAEALGLRLPSLTEKHATSLAGVLPAAASTANPIDVLGDADEQRYEAALKTCLADPSIDGIAVLLTPQVMTPAADIARMMARVTRTAPLLPVVASFMGERSIADATAILREAGIPCFPTPERAMRALAALRPRKVTASLSPRNPSNHAKEADRIIGTARALLDEERTAALFSLYGLPQPAQSLARGEEEAMAITRLIGFPVILKASGADLIHKTDVGGIAANLRNEDDVRTGYRAILQNLSAHAPNATVRGILVQKFLPVGEEFIVGAVRDPSAGPVVLAGLGGIFTELFADTALRLAPVTHEESYDMLQELKAWKLLMGLRGKPRSDIDALARAVRIVGQMMIDCPAITDIDLNPVLVSHDGILVADAKVICR